jgi:hypothetical protein
LVSVALIAALAAAVAPPALGSASSRGPSEAQIRTAVRHVKRSPKLWATVNTCNTRAFPDTIGIRGQMPTLGFAASLSMSIQVDYWDSSARRFHPIPDPHARRLVALGRVSFGFQQGGHTFQFAKHAGLLRATVTFQWQRGRRLLGHMSMPTTGGHPDADGGSPPRHSAPTCRIP